MRGHLHSLEKRKCSDFMPHVVHIYYKCPSQERTLAYVTHLLKHVQDHQKSLMAGCSSPRHFFWRLIRPCTKQYIKQFNHTTNSCSSRVWGVEYKNAELKHSRINSNSDKWYFLLLLSYQRKLNCVCISTIFVTLNNNRLFSFASCEPFY